MNHSNNLILNLLLSFLFIFAQTLPLVAAPVQYENQQIEILDIIIETPTDRDCQTIKTVKSHIKTAAESFFSQAEFDADLKNLIKDFDRVEPQLMIVNGKLHITLKLWEKPLIRSITWCGNDHIKTSDLQSELGIKRLSTFDRLAFNKAFHKLKGYYVKEGYFEAALNYETVIDPITNEVDITIHIAEGRAGVINKIRFCGFTKCEEDDIIDLMITKEYNFFFSWYTKEGTYHEEAAQQDQFVIVNYLQNQGYADAKVDIAIIEKCKNKIDLIITADKGELYHFGAISFTGNELFCDEEIITRFTFAERFPYSVEKIRDTIAAITDMYGRKGYIDASVDFEPSLDIDTLTYAVNLVIDEGAQHRVGLIKVFGNCTTQTSVILHESLLIPGDIFNIDKLKDTETKLKNVGYFEEVNVYAVKSEGPMGLGDYYRDVHIEVKETSTGHFGAFAGYSTSESLFGGVNITERNFNYRGLRNVWRDGFGVLRGGGEYAHATVQIGLKSRKYIASWAKPFFMDTKWTVGFDLENSNNRYISTDYEINSTALIAHANYRYNEFVRVGWHYRIKNSDVQVDSKHHKKKSKDSSDKHKNDGKKSTVDADLEEKSRDRELEEDSENDGLISAMGFSLTYDSTDHPVMPRAGFRSNFDFEFAGIGGDHTFFSLAYLNAYFVPFGKKNVIRCRADFRFIFPFGGTTYNSLPIDERLFLGGDTMVRGYRSYRLGPFYRKSKNPRGGISEQFYSIELARRLHDRVEAFTYFDAGYLSSDRLKFDMPYCAIGVGAKIKIIESIPSLTLGYGIPLNPQNNSQVKRFFISIGGKF
jgi:outer membrane protein insertion porin family